MTSPIKHIFKLASYTIQYGPHTCLKLWLLRKRKKYFSSKYRTNSFTCAPHKNIHKILNNHALINWVTGLPTHELFKEYASKNYLDVYWITQHAKNITNYNFTVFEHHTISCDKQTIPWQHDYLYDQQNNNFNTTAWDCTPEIEYQAPYCFDINIPDIYDNTKPTLPDMRVCWELSRLQFLYILGKAYSYDTHNRKYKETFKHIILDWHKKNQFLQGVNWICPMEVAIRAINMIWGLAFFIEEQTINTSFWQNYLTSLHKHMIYLEHTWEKTWHSHNHYLSNLVGYAYLTKLFGETKKYRWCMQEILKEVDHQILNDGTDFEGSSRYHQLVTELIMQVIIIVENKEIISILKAKLALMLKFSNNLYINSAYQVMIGDDDSGKIVTGINLSSNKHSIPKLFHYPNFGISIIHDSNIHTTYRHPTYHKNQPNGHFHEDELSITLAINNIPLLVDPGSYVYTGNAPMRNVFRRKESHNTLYLENETNGHMLDSPNLFKLDRKQQSDSVQINKSHEKITIQNSTQNDIENTIQTSRTLEYNTKKKCFKLYDQWIRSPQKQKNDPLQTYHGTWNFLFHPNVTLEKSDNYTWHILHKNIVIAQLSTEFIATKQNYWFSPYYSKKITCIKLCAKAPVSFDKKTNTSQLFTTIISW